MLLHPFFFKNRKSENPSFIGFSDLKTIKIHLTIPFLLAACASPLGQKSPPEPKLESLKATVCESEVYVGNSDYKQRSDKEYINKLKNGEQVYLQTEVKRCEEVFDEGADLECAIHKTIKLIWEKDEKPIDTFTFLDSGCEKPNSRSLNMEPWDQNGIAVRKDVVRVGHYWNYYSHSEEEDERCMSHVFKLDRGKMKLRDLGEKRCR